MRWGPRDHASRRQLAALAALVAAVTAAGYPANGWAQPASSAERRVVFMVDRSGSMPVATNRPVSSFQAAMTNARTRAATIIDAFAGRSDVAVSFWSFGNKDRHAIIDGARGLSPTEARTRLDAVFSDDSTIYTHGHTFTDYSIFQVVKAELGLPADFGPDDDVPDDASLFQVCVVTDGTQNVGRFDNRPYAAWVARHEKRNLIRRDGCDIDLYAPLPPEVCTGGLDEDGDGAIDCQDTDCTTDPMCVEIPPDEAIYDVVFGLPTTAFSFNPLSPLQQRTIDLEVPRLVRLVPRGLGARLDPGERADGNLVCRGDTTSSPSPSPAQALAVQATVGWPSSIGVGATGEWALAAPARAVVDAPTSIPGRTAPRIVRETLRLTVSPPTRAVVPKADIPDGAYPVRFVMTKLCAELRRAYPNSHFVLPEDSDAGLQRLGDIVAARVPVFTFVLGSKDGAQPNAPLPELSANVLHQYDRTQRTLVLTPPEGAAARVHWSVTVRRDGEPEAEASQLVGFEAATGRGPLVTVPAGAALNLVVPAEKQVWWECALGGCLAADSGSYALDACARVQLVNPPPGPHRVDVICPECDPTRVGLGDATLCVTVPASLDRRPLWWLWWLLIAITAIIAAWVGLRWWTRPRFPRGLAVGTELLREGHEKGIEGRLAALNRRPAYAHLLDGGRVILSREHHRPADGAASELNVVGLRPLPKGTEQVLLWCAAVGADGEHGPARYELEVTGATRSLTPRHDTPDHTTTDNVVRIRHSLLRDRPTDLVLHELTADGQRRRETRFPLAFLHN